MTVDPRVDAWIEALPDWQAAICREVRAVVHAVDPEIVETIKRTTQPYFTLQGNVCALLAAKDHVNVFVYDGGLVPDPHGVVTGGHGNSTARTVAIRRGEPVPSAALGDLLRQLVADNRAGGWRRLKQQRAAGDPRVEAYLAALPADTQPTARRVWQTMRDAVPGSGETISYQMPTVTLDGVRLVHLGAWKQHLGVYPVPDLPELAPYLAGRGTARFGYDDPPLDLVTRLTRALAARRD
ncbi:DUF1801 domain-containing protein [Angustibacter aerolatus]